MSKSASLQAQLDQTPEYRRKNIPTPGENEVFKDLRNNGRLLMRIGGIEDYDTFIELTYDDTTGWEYAENATPIQIGFGDKQAFAPYKPEQ